VQVGDGVEQGRERAEGAEEEGEDEGARPLEEDEPGPRVGGERRQPARTQEHAVLDLGLQSRLEVDEVAAVVL